MGELHSWQAQTKQEHSPLLDQRVNLTGAVGHVTAHLLSSSSDVYSRCTSEVDAAQSGGLRPACVAAQCNHTSAHTTLVCLFGSQSFLQREEGSARPRSTIGTRGVHEKARTLYYTLDSVGKYWYGMCRSCVHVGATAGSAADCKDCRCRTFVSLLAIFNVPTLQVITCPLVFIVRKQREGAQRDS